MGEWLEEVNRVLAVARATETTMRGMKDVIFGIWRLMNESGENLRDTYRSFSESDVVAAASSLDWPDCLSAISAPSTSMAEKKLVYRELAARLRALENRFYSEHDGSTARHPDAFDVEFDGNEAYFLDWAPKNRLPKDRGSFAKRALARSRIIPKTIGANTVRIYPLEDPIGVLRARNGVKLKFGAGLFENLDFSFGFNDDGFIVDAVVCEQQAETIAGQLVEATKEICGGVVYPELTIAEDVLVSICEFIGDGQLDIELSMVVAGSRHVKGDDGLVRNIATIVDGYGQQAVKQSKFFRYSEGPKPSESIEPGTELAVVILGDAVLVCAICLDFCHLTEPTPYDNVDVDCILVPSCGENKTMESHVVKAQDVRRRHTISTLVVQQFHDGKPTSASNPLGYVLGPDDLENATAHSTATTNPWSIVAI